MGWLQEMERSFAIANGALDLALEAHAGTVGSHGF